MRGAALGTPDRAEEDVMDMSFPPEIENFRQEVRSFFEAHLDAALVQAGSLSTGICSDYAPAMAWQKILHQQGWAAPHWPQAYGGTGWDPLRRYIFTSESARAGAPRLAPMGLGMIGPTLIVHGSQAQKDYYLPRILSGDDFWCQGYSEPGSGSDLASLSCRAERDGDDYIVSGTKIWTTMAHHANMIFALVRTDTTVKPQKGISFLLIDMTSPGIEVRPIITLSGDHEVNQVFFDGVRVPVANLVGAENDGWTVAKALLAFERSAAYAARLREKRDRIAALVISLGDPDLTGRLSELDVRLDALETSEFRIQAAHAAELAGHTAQQPDLSASARLKISGTELQQAFDTLTIEALGHQGLRWTAQARAQGALSNHAGPALAIMGMADYMSNRAASVYGGSNEIQRGIIAKQYLQM